MNRIEAQGAAQPDLEDVTTPAPSHEDAQTYNDPDSIRRSMPPVGTFSFPILEAPREIRDLFYMAWLESSYVHAMTYEEWIDECYTDDGNDWENAHLTPRFWSPFKLKKEEVHWRASFLCPEPFTCFNWMYIYPDTPVLWSMNKQMRHEAKGLHFGERIMLEMDHLDSKADCMQAFNKWVSSTPDHDLETIRKLHLLVKCTLVAPEHFASIIRRTEGHGEYAKTHRQKCIHAEMILSGSFEDDDALFRLELKDDKKTLQVRTFGSLIKEQETLVRKAIQEWWTRLPVDKEVYSGHDLLEVVRILKGIEAGFQALWVDQETHECRNIQGPQPTPVDLSCHGWMVQATDQSMSFVSGDEIDRIANWSDRKKHTGDGLTIGEGVEKSGENMTDTLGRSGRFMLKDGYHAWAWTNKPQRCVGVAHNHILVQVSLGQQIVHEGAKASVVCDIIEEVSALQLVSET